MGRYRPADSDPRTTPFNASSSSSQSQSSAPTVRFELPFAIVCLSCEQSLAQATRYNARKTRAGQYYSTPIWHFTCRCRHCQAVFVIATDPKNAAYEVVQGARKLVTAGDVEDDGDDDDAGLTMVEVDLTQTKGRSLPGELRRRVHGDNDNGNGKHDRDAFSQLEATTSRLSKQQQINQRTLQLHEYASSRSSDPGALNAKLRSDFRRDKHRIRGVKDEQDQFKRTLEWSEHMHAAPPLSEKESQDARKHFRRHRSKQADSNTTSARDTLLKSVRAKR